MTGAQKERQEYRDTSTGRYKEFIACDICGKSFARTNDARECPCGKPKHTKKVFCNPHPCDRCGLPVHWHLNKICEHCHRNSD